MAKVLVVDDEEHMRYLCREFLEERDFQAITAESGYRLLEKIRDENPDVVVLDIKMVDYNGLDLLQQIREEFYLLPVILYTAYDTFKDETKADLADFYVIKSFEVEELINKITLACEEKVDIDSVTPATIQEDTKRILRCLLNHQSRFFLVPEEIPAYSSLIRDFEKRRYFDLLTREQMHTLSKAVCNDFCAETLAAFRIAADYLASKKLRTADSVRALYERACPKRVLSLGKFETLINQIEAKRISRLDWVPSDFRDLLEPNPKRRKQKPLIANVILRDIRHDMKSNLSKMLMYLSKYKNLGDIDTYKKLRELHSSLISLYERLKDISLYGVIIEPVAFDLRDLVRNVLEELSLDDERIMHLDFGSYDQKITADKNLLSLALRQVLQNAIEAISDDGHIQISIENDQERGQVRLIVEDNGCGIPEDIIGEVLDADVTTKRDHSGIGLSLAHSALSEIGGEIEIDSEEGHGTTVEISVPWEA
jgi:signal transduction histidine kinase/FixJ family two-component response regulator